MSVRLPEVTTGLRSPHLGRRGRDRYLRAPRDRPEPALTQTGYQQELPVAGAEKDDPHMGFTWVYRTDFGVMCATIAWMLPSGISKVSTISTVINRALPIPASRR